MSPTAPEVVFLPAGMTPDAARAALAAAVAKSDLIEDVACALSRTWTKTPGLIVYPVSDPVWVALARTAVDRVEAAR